MRAGQGARHRRRCSSATSPRRARSPARACSSTSSTACCSSRASASAPTARCARSRTASARPTRSASSRCARAAWSRCSTPARASSARPRARPAASCSRRWRARGRCSSRSRRSSRRPSSCRRGASATGSTATGSRSCSPCSPATRRRAGSADVFVNVVGGVRVDEPGADLAVALAVASAARGVAAAAAGRRAPLAAFGEVGLTGELRSVAHPERRLAEAAKFGLSRSRAERRRTLRDALRRCALRAARGGCAAERRSAGLRERGAPARTWPRAGLDAPARWRSRDSAARLDAANPG